MAPYAWNTRRSLVWGAHILAVAPYLYVFRNNELALTALVVAMLGYHAHRMFIKHGCSNSYAELNLFHIVFVAPLLVYMAQQRMGDGVGVVALSVATYFAGKFALYGACVRR